MAGVILKKNCLTLKRTDVSLKKKCGGGADDAAAAAVVVLLKISL